MDDLSYDITLLMLFSFVGIIIKLFIGQEKSSDGSYGPASASIWGYGLVALCVLSMIMITFTLATKNNLGEKSWINQKTNDQNNNVINNFTHKYKIKAKVKHKSYQKQRKLSQESDQ